MSDHTKIEWTDRTWNPVTGCTKVSAGCDHCYAETIAERFRGGLAFPHGFDVQLREHKLTEPLRWREPSKVFVNSMSDLFHDAVPIWYLAKVFAVMALAPQHTFQVLTKRHARMRSLLSSGDFQTVVAEEMLAMTDADEMKDAGDPFPLPNVWLGVSVEDQRWADIRIPALLDTPAAVRFISAEPLLGPIRLRRDWGHGPGIDWIIVGGESGRGARPMHPDWARDLRDHRDVVGAAFLFKQWGEWAPRDPDELTGERADVFLDYDGNGTYFANRYRADVQRMVRVGKPRAGRDLDGRTWDEYPGGDR